MSWKNERIEKYGEEAYERKLEQQREWYGVNPEKVKERSHDLNRKGGKYYEKKQKYDCTGLRCERRKIRALHAKKWHDFKKVIAPDSQIHHEWIPETADYKGVALVEADQHRYGIIDVIQILDCTITLFTENEIREQEWEHVNR